MDFIYLYHFIVSDVESSTEAFALQLDINLLVKQAQVASYFNLEVSSFAYLFFTLTKSGRFQRLNMKSFFIQHLK